MDRSKQIGELEEQTQVSINLVDATSADVDATIDPSSSPVSVSGSFPVADELVGQTILGHYQVLSVIGTGGMSVVYKARHLMLNQSVAIKMLHAHLTRHEHALMRFRQEAQSASRLRDDGIVGIKDFGVMPTGQPYLIMDYVPGSNLADLVSRDSIAPKRALRLCSMVCEALSHAHQKGIVHRDIKPSNVIVLNEGTDTESIKVVDFGIAKVVWEDLNASGEGLTHTGESLGSPPYMSPEQCQGRPLDARSDVYSTGCLLFELLTGRPPFKGGSVFETIHMQISQLPESVSKFRPGIRNAERLDAILLKAMAKDPADRFQTMDQFDWVLQHTLDAFDESPNLLQSLGAQVSIMLTRLRAHRNAIAIGLCFIAILSILLVVSLQAPQVANEPEKATVIVSDPILAFQKAYQNALMLYSEDDFKDAKVRFEEAMLHADGIGEESAEYRDCLEKLAACCEHTGDAAGAADANNRLARLSMYGDSLGSSEKNADLINTLSIAESTPANQKALAKVLTDQSGLYLVQHKIAMATNIGENAVKKAREAYPMNSYEVGRAINYYVGALIENDDFKQAVPLLQELKKIAEANKDKSSRLLIDANLREARMHCRTARYRVAAAGIEREQLLATKPMEGAAADEAALAIKPLEEAINLCNKEKEADPRLGECLTQLGHVYTMLGRWEQAEHVLANASKVTREIYGDHSVQSAKVDFYQGINCLMHAVQPNVDALTKQRLLKQSDAALGQAQEAFEMRSGDAQNSAFLGETLDLRGRANAELGNFAEAEKYYKASIRIAAGWVSDCWTAKTAYQRLDELYKNSNMKEDEKVKVRARLLEQVQKYKSIDLAAPKPVNDLDQPIGDNDL